MVNILPRRASLGQKFGQAFAGLGQAAGQAIPQHLMEKEAKGAREREYFKQNQIYKSLTGRDLSSDPNIRMKEIEFALKGQNDEQKQRSKYENQLKMIKESGLDFDEMKGQDHNQTEKSQPKGILKPEFYNESSNNISSKGSQLIPENKIAKMALINPAVADKMQKHNDNILAQSRHKEGLQSKVDLANRKDETDISKPILIELNESRKNIPLQEQAIEDIKNAAPDVGALDYIADVTGFEPLRSASGVKLKTAIKDFFLSDLSRAGARPNMWIEQQLADALPKLGRSTEANLITAEGMQFKVDLAKKRIETLDKIAEKDRKNHGYVKGDIDSRAYKEMKKYVIDRQHQLRKDIERIKEDTKKGKVPIGTKLNENKALEFLEMFSGDRQKAEAHAKELGYE